MNAITCACVLATLLGGTAVAQTPRFIDFSTYPGGGAIPANTTLTTQLAGSGVLLGARRSTEPPGVQGSVAFRAMGSPTPACSRWWFFSPDVYGATAIFTFVDPVTQEPIDAVRFQVAPGFDSDVESIDVVGLDADNQVTAIQTVNNTCNRCTPLIVLHGRFRKVEVRTRGNPGIGFSNCLTDGTLAVSYVPCINIVSSTDARTPCPDASTTFQVEVNGTPELTYQWQVAEAAAPGGWVNITDGIVFTGGQRVGVFTGAASPTLTAGGFASEPGTPIIGVPVLVRCVVANPCGTVTSSPATLTVLTPCSIADVCPIGGPAPGACPDGLLTGDDFNAFIAAFAAGEPLADVTGIGGPPSVPDGLITGDDFNAFIAAFAAGCS